MTEKNTKEIVPNPDPDHTEDIQDPEAIADPDLEGEDIIDLVHKSDFKNNP